MADNEQEKREQVSSNVNIPNIEITEEGASGGAEVDGKGKTGILRSLADKMKNIGHGKRSKSTSPEDRKDKSRVEGGSSKENLKHARPSLSPFKMADKFKGMFASSGKGCDDEMENLCEGEVTEHKKTHLAPPEKDMGIASPSSPTEPMAEKCDTYDRSSSISSAPSGYSSLPDDDTDVTSPDDLDSPKEGKV